MSDPSPASGSPSDEKSSLTTKRQYGYSSRSTYAQALATIIQGWILIDHGLMMGASTLILGALHGNPNEELNMDDAQASWFGSLPYFCTPLANFASGFVQEALGRRGSGMLVNIPIFAAWILLSFADSIATLYVVAIIMGVCIGLSEAPLNSYLGEIGEPHIRGTLITMTSTAISTGMTIMYGLGVFFDWRTTALISSIFPVLTFALMSQIPESPAWLISHNRLDEAKKALCWLRGWVGPDEVEEEFQNLLMYAKKSAKEAKASEKTGDIDSKTDCLLMTQLKALTNKNVLRPLRLVLISFTITFLAVVSGMRPYSINELNALNSPVDPKIILILFQILFILGAVAYGSFLRDFGKRKIALFSNGIAAASIIGIGVFCSFFLDASEYPYLVWFPSILLLVINFLSGFGLYALPWQLMSEVFPQAGRGLATGISAAWTHLVVSALIKSYLYIKAWVGLSGVMYLYGATTFLGFLYYYLYLPETEGKSLEQIESYFTDDPDLEEFFSVRRSPATDAEKIGLRSNKEDHSYGSTA
ncbi:unnamed protein product [Bemisia tabaci]|uniref:Major facilitator superfamily (MFS) profile domain-containing protein n=2 Tax=Bemisia tabaci TaxID=7038 RepID=A0A9P0EYV1_BEMTA|nr:unnamed protein product [Bemisia tabaci]